MCQASSGNRLSSVVVVVGLGIEFAKAVVVVVPSACKWAKQLDAACAVLRLVAVADPLSIALEIATTPPAN